MKTRPMNGLDFADQLVKVLCSTTPGLARKTLELQFTPADHELARRWLLEHSGGLRHLSLIGFWQIIRQLAVTETCAGRGWDETRRALIVLAYSVRAQPRSYPVHWVWN